MVGNAVLFLLIVVFCVAFFYFGYKYAIPEVTATFVVGFCSLSCKIRRGSTAVLNQRIAISFRKFIFFNFNFDFVFNYDVVGFFFFFIIFFNNGIDQIIRFFIVFICLASRIRLHWSVRVCNSWFWWVWRNPPGLDDCSVYREWSHLLGRGIREVIYSVRHYQI